MDDNIYCVTTAVARGRELLRSQGIVLPYMQCGTVVQARQGALRLLKLATALKLTYQEALEYGFITVSNNPVVLKALVVVWNVGKRNPIPPTDGRRGKRKKRSKRK